MSDIKRIGNRYYDFGTKNKSFLLTAQELKTLGIKNWYFMLEVKNPGMGVQDIDDPYSKDLSQEDIARICIECKQNPWFFFREVAKVPVRGAGKLPPILSRASLAVIWCFMHSIDFILCQPRQTHKSTWCTLLLEYMFIFEYQNIEIPMMHIRQDRCLESAEMLRDYICALPPYMNPWYGRTKLPGTKSLAYDEHHTSITILSQADSIVKAKDKMRGMTLFAAMLEEWEYIPYQSSVMEGAMPAIISGREIAAKTNGRTCIMLLSTPGDLETDTGRSAQHMIDMTPVFSEQLYDFTEEELAEYFAGMTTLNEDGDPQPVTTLYIEFNYKQLRKDEKWLRAQYNEALRLNRLDEYRRGVLLQRYRGSDSVLFQQEDIDYIVQHTKEPDYDIFLLKKFHLYVYKHKVTATDINSSTPYFDITMPYMIGVDIAAGGNGDNTAICIVNPYTMEVVGELISPFIGTTDLMRILLEIAKLCPKAIFCVETNSIGKAIVDLIQETKLEYRFYHDPKLDISKNAVTKESPEEALKRRAVEKGYIGTYVTPSVRNSMFDLLKTHVKDYHQLLTTKYLAKDITNLVRAKNGKIEAAEGFHDDMVMAYNHVLYIWYYGYRIERFGIYKSKSTFQKATAAIEQYEEQLDEKTINNMIPYDIKEAYENQLLHDLTTQDPMHYFGSDGTDEYGYRREDYNRAARQQQAAAPANVAVASSSDLAFFNEVNSYATNPGTFADFNSYF